MDPGGIDGPVFLPADGPATAALRPIALGPCTVDDKTKLTIGLLGGETAVRSSSKQKFELTPSGEGNRAWRFLLSGGAAPDGVQQTSETVEGRDAERVERWVEELVARHAREEMEDEIERNGTRV